MGCRQRIATILCWTSWQTTEAYKPGNLDALKVLLGTQRSSELLLAE